MKWFSWIHWGNSYRCNTGFRGCACNTRNPGTKGSYSCGLEFRERERERGEEEKREIRKWWPRWRGCRASSKQRVLRRANSINRGTIITRIISTRVELTGACNQPAGSRYLHHTWEIRHDSMLIILVSRVKDTSLYHWIVFLFKHRSFFTLWTLQNVHVSYTWRKCLNKLLEHLPEQIFDKVSFCEQIQKCIHERLQRVQ